MTIQYNSSENYNKIENMATLLCYFLPVPLAKFVRCQMLSSDKPCSPEVKVKVLQGDFRARKHAIVFSHYVQRSHCAKHGVRFQRILLYEETVQSFQEFPRLQPEWIMTSAVVFQELFCINC